MPNIIEQQDLLKGLPDAKLTMLLQNPVGDIPPFLVAAEAQRRQTIRQQFAGQASNESVVDTLTKQLSKVPQNLNAPMQQPPMIPPTPPMEGVAALQAQQAMQAGQQPQQMRSGGMVQRYQYGGQVQPWWEIPDISGGVANAAGYIGGKVSDLAEWATTPYSERKEEEDRSELPNLDTMTPEDLAEFNASVALPDVNVGRRAERPTGPRTEEIARPQPGETEDEFRARIEALYATREPSDWEKSQRWFAMAEQFLDPSKTTMQSVAGAGRAFAEQSAAMDAAKREAELAREKAMLEYDMARQKSIQDAQREAAQAERERTTISAEKYADVLGKRLESISRLISAKDKALSDTFDENEKARLQKEINDLLASEQQISGMLASLGETAYGPVSYDTYSLTRGFQR